MPTVVATKVGNRVRVCVDGLAALTWWLDKHQVEMHCEIAAACQCGSADCLPCTVAKAVQRKDKDT